MRNRIPPQLAVAALAALVLAAPAFAVVVPERTPVSEKELVHPDLNVSGVYRQATQLPGSLAASASLDLAALGVRAENSYFDLRSGRWGTLMPVEPLLPGTGFGNSLTWGDLGVAPPAGDNALAGAAWDAFVGYLATYREQLRIDPAELTRPGRVHVVENGNLIQIHAPRVVGGLPVRESYLTAVINRGNLILFGARNWDDVDVATEPSRTREEAMSTLQAYMGSINVTGTWRRPTLALVPMAAGAFAEAVPGRGLAYRLVWVLSPEFGGELGQWEALVDAHSNELISFQDTAHYASVRNVVGGVLPVSNDGASPDGVEQAGWPMPFADLTNNAVTRFTDSAGVVNACLDGTISTTLAGTFIRMQDDCGAINVSTAADTLNLGTSAGTDCTVPGGTSPGNTHASRSGFYELNRIKEQARAYLPNNSWLGQQLTARMNVSQTCNANWNGVQVNFFRSGGGCRNTGEIAGIFDHEWGHGMDNNDTNPNVSRPGEGIADIYASLRLNTSCIGRGFLVSGLCGGYGDPCTVASGCSGVRDIDWANRASGAPHTLAWIDANCGSGSTQPCGGSTHCEGAVYAESVWDIWNRDLQAVPFSLDQNTAMEIAARLTFLGASPVGQWYNCVPGTGTGDGCNADGGYLNYLAADDDNANLADGTPHMGAINAAFARHGIACPTPAVANSGCAGAPTTAPTLSATPRDKGANLSWTAVAGATKYAIYRAEGVFGCDFGKEKVGETTGLTFVDENLLNGFGYSYMVAAIGAADTCHGPMSSCTALTPAAGPNLAIDGGAAGIAIVGGDGDEFLDNCEAGLLSVPVFNTGTGSLTNVRVIDVQSPTHPGTVILTSLPLTIAPTLAACGSATAAISFQAEGLATNDTIEFEVEITADQLSPLTRTQTITVNATENDFQNFATKTFTFEASTEDWSVITGTFARTNTGGGGNGTSFYMESSSLLDNQCDQVASPLFKLNTTSTLSLFNQFDIEPFFVSGGVWYDRANVGLTNPSTGSRTLLTPTGGRLYNASGQFGTCGTTNQGGWAGSGTTWTQSTWSAAGLGSVANAGQVRQLTIFYGTDGGDARDGFHFDEVTLTNVDVQAADAQPNVCTNDVLFADGFESGNTSAWAATVP